MSCPTTGSVLLVKLSGRHSMTYEEEEWVSQDATADRRDE